jgi:hypothetical protein
VLSGSQRLAGRAEDRAGNRVLAVGQPNPGRGSTCIKLVKRLKGKSESAIARCRQRTGIRLFHCLKGKSESAIARCRQRTGIRLFHCLKGQERICYRALPLKNRHQAFFIA